MALRYGRVLVRAAAAAVALAALSGCGAGASSPFADFFGAGQVPGGGATVVEQRGTVTGVVARRDRDGHILILARLADATEPATPVPGVRVAIPQQNRSLTTTADGTYRFTEVVPGDLTLRIILPTSLGGATADFAIRLDPGETIAGLPPAVNQ